MIWFLVFCSHVYLGEVCTAPSPMPSMKACQFTGQQMVDLAGYNAEPRFRCIGFRKGQAR